MSSLASAPGLQPWPEDMASLGGRCQQQREGHRLISYQGTESQPTSPQAEGPSMSREELWAGWAGPFLPGLLLQGILLISPEADSEVDIHSWKTGRKQMVLVSTGCHNKYHQLGHLKNRHLLLTVLERKSPRSRCQLI